MVMYIGMSLLLIYLVAFDLKNSFANCDIDIDDNDNDVRTRKTKKKKKHLKFRLMDNFVI